MGFTKKYQDLISNNKWLKNTDTETSTNKEQIQLPKRKSIVCTGDDIIGCTEYPKPSTILKPQTNTNKDALFLACELNQKDICKSIISNNAIDLEICDIEGYTALHIAVNSSSWDCVDVLLQYGAKLRTKTLNGMTLLHTLAFTNSTDHSDTNAVTKQIEYMIRFIQLGADLNAKTSLPDIYKGHLLTPLDIALISSNDNAVLLLLEASMQLEYPRVPYTDYIKQKEVSKVFDDYMLYQKENFIAKCPVPSLTSLTRRTIREVTSQSRVFTKCQLGLPQLLVDYVNLESLESDYLRAHARFISI